MGLIIPYFTISMYGSSCNFPIIGLILSSFLSIVLFLFASYSSLEMPLNRKRKQRSENATKKREH